MHWLNPAAWFSAAVVAAPILLHLLVRRRAERRAFPTLRFIRPTRLASLSRRMLDDVPLLVVRAGILIAAVAALAAPLLVTAARQRAWSARVVRGTVSGANLSDGIRRAAAALEHAPPARREVVVTSPFPIGSVTAADIASVPASIGIRLERSGTLPAETTIAGASLITSDGAIVSREIALTGSRTSVGETLTADRAPWPIDVDAPPAARRAIDAAIAAVLSQRVWAPPPDRRARLLLNVARGFQRRDGGAERAARQITLPWMADAMARIARDEDLQAAAARSSGALDVAFSEAPWHVVAVSADGRPLIAAAAGSPQSPAASHQPPIENQLLVASAAPASDLVTPLVMRSIVNGLAAVPNLQTAEVVAIPDAQLRAWSRPAPEPSRSRLDTIDRDDRRWLWAAVLVLLAIETWMRRARAVEPGQEVRHVA